MVQGFGFPSTTYQQAQEAIRKYRNSVAVTASSVQTIDHKNIKKTKKQIINEVHRQNRKTVKDMLWNTLEDDAKKKKEERPQDNGTRLPCRTQDMDSELQRNE